MHLALKLLASITWIARERKGIFGRKNYMPKLDAS
jgi:hypothetical protein